MNEDVSDTVQLRFEDGRLADPPTENDTTDGYTVDPIAPGDRTGYVVEVRSGALATNSGLGEAVETHGRTLEFGSRSHAEDYAQQLAASGGSLRVQAAPDNDRRNVDAYLLADHDPSIGEPADVDGDTWTFDVGANLYGALGETVLLEPPNPHALEYFVRQDLNLDDDDRLERGLNVDIQSGGIISIDGDQDADPDRWIPDCEIVAADGWDGPVLARYYCEIKTGNASYQRSQIAAMEELAREERVLKIRVQIEELPERYSLRIREVEPPV